ncbi:MAG: hypothetical protein NVSMB47_03040 [Polyangiales bacterium]
MTATPDDGAARPQESRKQRVNRELTELLSELRIALTGAQLLFTFLLTVPFTARFAAIATSLRHVFFATFVCTGLATTFLLAPSAQHRLSFRAHDKEGLLLRSNRLTMIGVAFLALAMVGVSYFVTGMVLGDGFALPIAAGTLTTIAVVWYVPPLLRRLRDEERTSEPPG